MKAIFWGTPEVAVPFLQALYDVGHKILAVLTQPDRRQGRNQCLEFSPVKQFAVAKGIAVLQPESPNTKEFAAYLAQLSPDIMIVVAYGKIFSKKLLNLPIGYGWLNVHFSLLPKYRGASPVNAAILAGEKKTGVSIMRIAPQVDAGPILSAAPVFIAADDTTGSLCRKLEIAGSSLLLETLTNLANGKIVAIPQDENTVSYCSLIEKDHGQIDWSQTAAYLERFVRAMLPWPTPYTFLHCQDKKVQRVIIRSSEVVEDPAISACGTVVGVNERGIEVATGENILRITSLQKAGRAVLDTSSFLQGTSIRVGDIFTGETGESKTECPS